jgi:S-adenosylmethionine:tRNA ribosyltransferase-isomerase
MDLALFDYELPPALVAQEPAEPRDAARLLLLDRARGGWEDRCFADLPALLRPGDCLVVNTTRVIPARLGARTAAGRALELLLVPPAGLAGGDPGRRWEALVRPARACPVGARLTLDGGATATVVGTGAEGTRLLEIAGPATVLELLARHGRPPLPPYIGRHAAPRPEDAERYQTVYAREPGSIAAPTAGLHFTPRVLERLQARGVERRELTLHVGPATFRPIRAAAIEAHRMAPEAVTIPPATAAAVNRARAEGRRVVAVGTTTTRALEWAAGADGTLRAGTGEADLFIRPGHRFRVVDALLTNFHLPRSSLLVLVVALAGRELVLAAYRHAVARQYRFYSYGDAMLVV